MHKYFRYFPITIFCVILVTTLCLIPIEDPPLKDVRFIDKWTHLVLFGAISFFMYIEGVFGCRSRLWTVPFIVALYGGVIELMQAYLTTYRSGEWLDFAADAVGAFLAFPVAFLFSRKSWTHRPL